MSTSTEEHIGRTGDSWEEVVQSLRDGLHLLPEAIREDAEDTIAMYELAFARDDAINPLSADEIEERQNTLNAAVPAPLDEIVGEKPWTDEAERQHLLVVTAEAHVLRERVDRLERLLSSAGAQFVTGLVPIGEARLERACNPTPCGCEFQKDPELHDQLLQLESMPAAKAARVVAGIIGDVDPNTYVGGMSTPMVGVEDLFGDPGDFRRFVAQHNWRDPTAMSLLGELAEGAAHEAWAYRMAVKHGRLSA